MSSLKLT